MDIPGGTTDRIMQQLTEYDLIPEEWGGDTICVPVSAVTKMNIDKLLEAILLVAEMKELKANPNRAAKGIVIEARLDEHRGPIATLLVQHGTLHSGDIIVAGTSVGRVRVMVDDKGRKVNEAGPSVPVEIMGLAEAPQAGDAFDAVSDERLARELVEQRKQKQKEEQFKSFEKVTLENLFSSLKEGELKELNIIVKADVQGSVEAVKQSLEKLSNEEVRVKIIHGGVGAINESDVMLANASNAIIVGFNVRPDPVAAQNAERDGVDIRCYRIIYDCIDEIQAAIKGMLAPKFREVQQGRAEVRQIVKISSVGNIAGCYVLSGKVTRNSKIRVVRDGVVITEDEISSLRRFKDDVKEVAQNFECGIGLAKFNVIKECATDMAGYRIDRISEDIKREIVAVMRELKDPRVQGKLLTVVKVEVSSDASFAKVFVSSMSGIDDARTAVKGLYSAMGYIRREVGHRLGLRKTPALKFVAADSIEHGMNIARMLDDLKEDEDAN